jgi:hypothetical protein
MFALIIWILGALTLAVSLYHSRQKTKDALKVSLQAFIAFPLAGAFLRQGADVRSVAAFVTTLVMVGVATTPLEIKFFGRKFTSWRNGLSFVLKGDVRYETA